MTNTNIKFQTFTHMKNSLNTFAGKLSKHLTKIEPTLKECTTFSSTPNFKYNISPTLTTESVLLINNLPVIISPFGGLEISNHESCKDKYNLIDMQSILKSFNGLKPTSNINFFSANSAKYKEYTTCTHGQLEVKNLEDITKISTQWDLFASNNKNKLTELNFEYDFELKCVKLAVTAEPSNNIIDSQTPKSAPQSEQPVNNPNTEMVTASQKSDVAQNTPTTDTLAKAAQSTGAAINQASSSDTAESFVSYFLGFAFSAMLVAEVCGNPLKWLAGENAGNEHFE